MSRAAILTLAALVVGGATMASANAAAVLSDRQMDVITAGSSTLLINLTANASGPSAGTQTVGEEHTQDARIMAVGYDRRTTALAHLSGIPVTLFFATGKATAIGADHADCSASTAIEGDFLAYLHAATHMVTPVTAICACAAFAVAPR